MTESDDEGRERARRWAIILIGGVALTVVGALVGSAFLVNNKAAPTGQGSGEDLQVVEYERPSAAGEDPFTTASDVDGEEVIRFKPASGSAGSDPNEPFGGSGSLHVCDREALVDFLLSHKKQRQAWAGVLGIDSDKDSVSRYVRSLTPVTLTVDTRITNHMYVNGRAVPFQSILVAGTAVLVDKYGRPVVRCKCGNPLVQPIYYPKIRCKGCPPHYKPPKFCKWRIYDPWYGYPPEWLPPEWRDPYPKSYPKPKSGVYEKGKYCYILYPDPPEVNYPPRWYPPQASYQQKPRYQPTYKPSDDDSNDYTDDHSDDHSDDPCGEHGCVNEYDPSDDMVHHDNSDNSDN